MSLVERRQDADPDALNLDPGKGERMMRPSFAVSTFATSTSHLALWWKKYHAATARAASASYQRVSRLFGFVEIGRLCAFLSARNCKHEIWRSCLHALSLVGNITPATTVVRSNNVKYQSLHVTVS